MIKKVYDKGNKYIYKTECEHMDIKTLCQKLNIDPEVTANVLAWDEKLPYRKMEKGCRELFDPSSWDSGLHLLKDICGEDPDGMKILTVCLHCLEHTYQMYQDRSIPDQIFWDTMGFLPRFLNLHQNIYGTFGFTWAWWFPRQISLREFRIGQFEYELLDHDGVGKISLHIPSDANLQIGDIASVYPFLQRYFPEYSNADILCDSWMMVPALQELLPSSSRILKFQNQFDIQRVDEENPAFMDWIYNSREIPLEDLPENTTLQRKVKAHLLSGGKIGWALGVYKGV